MSDPKDPQLQRKKRRDLTRRRFIQGSATFGTLGALGGGSMFYTSSAHADNIAVSADFAAGTGPALDKSRFGVFNSGLVGLDRYQRDADRLLALKPDSLRFDGGLWGFNINKNLVQGIGNYDFTEPDQLISLLNSRNVKPYWSYEYEPPPLQQNGDYKSPPNNLDNWARVLADIASHFKNSGHPVGYHEIWNEPDLGTVFWTGNQNDYNNIYQRGVTAIRGVDPAAIVGGPALAIATGWADEFLNFLTSHQLPLDYFSFHHYGTDYDGALQAMQGVKAKYGLANTVIHLNEYNPYTNRTNDTNSPCDRFPAAAQLLTDFKNFLNYPYLRLVSWAQFMDPGDGFEHIGLVSVDGHVKAAYNGWAIYARMPVDRRQVSISGSLQAMASTDGSTASLVVWNQSGSDQTTTITLNNLPFSNGTLTVYRIDGTYSSYYDNPQYEALTQTESHAGVSSGWNWSGTVPNNGVVYFEAKTGSGGGGSPFNPNTYYKIVNKYSGKLMAVSGMSQSDGAQITQWNDNGTPDHLWKFVDAGGGYYKIVNKNSGKLMAVSGMSLSDGANVTQWNDNGTPDHLWQPVDAGGGYYKIVNKNSGKLLAVSGMSLSDGANVPQWNDNGTPDHLWQPVAS